ncbi:hypothetical protein RB195_025042 [Necator americanus]|uniref:Endonuclease/exonuclease/phosphatase domain-containing protein n=1 Tax=Necator americanus TaxID=51031 RepID=A0ABR1EST6_NECAM
MAICTNNAHSLASEAVIEDLMMQARKIKYDVTGLTETGRRHPLNEMDLKKFYGRSHTFFKVIDGDFNAKIDPRRTPEELHIGTNGLQWNKQINPSSVCWTWESADGRYHSEVDNIIVCKRLCVTDVDIVAKFYTGSDHRLFRGRFSFTRREKKAAKFRKQSPRTIINWDLFATLAGLWKGSVMDNIDEECNRLV